MNYLKIEDLTLTPMLRKLLAEYVMFQYEENADTTDESLLSEYNYLLDNNRLEELFLQEQINNQYKQYENNRR